MTAAATADAVDRAYRLCDQITREQARNFSWGIRLLPPSKRTALSAVYAVARRIDDIGDGTLPKAEKLRLLAAERAASTAPEKHAGDPLMLALADAARRLPIPVAAFGDLIDGCEMDVRGQRYDTLDDLVQYCRCVAGSIGRLSLGVFDPGLSEPDKRRAADLADALGVALQLTNILRDVREDLGNGRVYLPKRDLDLFGCALSTLPDGTLDPCDGALAQLIRFEAAQAWSWYDRGWQLLDMLDARSAACCAAMSGIYLELLRRIAADPGAVMRGRLSLSASDKLRVATRALVGRGRRRG
jgi:15-cis-phytoene synthase